MKYVVELGSGAMMYIPSFMKTGSGIETLSVGRIHRHRQHGNSIPIFSFFKIRTVC
jgi:hypothetical protein